MSMMLMDAGLSSASGLLMKLSAGIILEHHNRCQVLVTMGGEKVCECVYLCELLSL